MAWSLLEQATRDIYDSASQAAELSIPVISVASTVNNASISKSYLKSVVGNAVPMGSKAWEQFYGKLTGVDRFRMLSESLTVDESGSLEEPEGGSDAFVVAFGAELDDQIFARQRETLFDPINYDLDTPPGIFPLERSIVFVDDSLNESLCAFGSTPCTSRWIDDDTIAATSGPDLEAGANVRKEIDGIKKGVGHGTGVAAVAVANPKNGVMAGIDPGANRFLYPFNFKAFNAAGFKEKVEAFLSRVHQPGQSPNAGFLVWNISGHTTNHAYAAPISAYLKRFAVTPLAPESDFFVFAAGNEPIDLVTNHLDAGDCVSYPACWSHRYKNVVTVAGATMKDGVPVPWQSTTGEVMTYLNPKFEIAAIASGIVVPSLTVDGFYQVEGTSYAAPQVAGIVSLLRYSMVSADLVEARLVACGIMSSEFVGRVLGGLLDARCSLTARKAQMAFEPIGAGETPVDLARKLRPGKVIGIWTVDKKRSEQIHLASDAPDGINGSYKILPELFKKSLVGYRQLVDDPYKYKVVVMDTSLGLKAEIREKIETDKDLFIQIQFDGEDKPTCVNFSQVISYVPAVPEAGGIDPNVSAKDSVCSFPAN